MKLYHEFKGTTKHTPVRVWCESSMDQRRKVLRSSLSRPPRRESRGGYTVPSLGLDGRTMPSSVLSLLSPEANSLPPQVRSFHTFSPGCIPRFLPWFLWSLPTSRVPVHSGSSRRRVRQSCLWLSFRVHSLCRVIILFTTVSVKCRRWCHEGLQKRKGSFLFPFGKSSLRTQ